MNNKLPLKINDYVRYASISQQHYKGALYSDAALNCRKACEAISKVIIYNIYSEKLADTKVQNCNLKDLITLVIKDGLAERKVINWLESLQIIGNKAAHDNIITKEEANYSLHALNLLTDWLFKDYLKISLPKILANEEPELILPIEPSVIEKIIVQEKISKETEDNLVNRVQHIIEEKSKDIDAQSKLDADTIAEIKKSLEEANQKINTINASKINEDKITIEPKPTKKWILVSVLVLVIIGIFSVFFFKSKKQVLPLELPITKNADTIYVAVNDLKILQDNPNINFKIESILQTYIDNLSSKHKLPIKITHTSFKQNDLIDDTSIVNHAERLGYDVVFLGNLYETALSDSNIIEIKGSFCGSNNRTNRSKKIKFKNLTDSTLIKEFNDQVNILPFFYAELPSNYTQALTTLSSLHYYSLENYSCALNIMVRVNLKLQNSKGCLAALNKLIAVSPPSSYYLAFKGGLFVRLRILDSAEIYSKRSLEIDSTYISALLNLAEIYSGQNKIPLSEATLLKALRYEPNNEQVNMDLALLYNYNPNPKLAKYYASKTFQLNPQNENANLVLAEYYAYESHQKDSAEFHYSLILKKDSNNIAGLNSLANYYLNSYVEKQAIAKYLLLKANNINVENKITNILGLGIAAFAEKDYKSCISFFEQATSPELFNNDVAKFLTLSYYFSNNLPKAFFYAKKGMDFDSSNTINQYNYAAMLALTEPDNIKKVCYYYTKAIKNDPKNLQTAKEYALYLNKNLKFKEALSVALPHYKANSSDFTLNQYISDSYLGLSNFTSALNYLEFLNISQPENYMAKRNLAFAIFNNNKGEKEQLARGSALIKDAIRLNPKDGQSHLIFAYYMMSVANISILQKMESQFLNCKKITKEEYLLARKLDSRIYDKELEDFIK